ncbi:ABC transporter substrate-binding protein [Paracraurococcus lichenis]|uniref:ABC transporter substrate-binding protein n=1 Tax=Paracraurococcus lichenis TaxID=3064888 RepID=A0ABT9E5Q7_9PROT|nr:ABC transporter substrate-binding protein [Paracraurococcus sp. LOR1-02]MDO9711466.1 ABC transporter substrate-binding protein [Paracraurococcus sp. LOR1-02]
MPTRRRLLATAGLVSLSLPAIAAAPEVAELRYQGWAGQVLFPELAEDLGYLAPLKLKWVGNTISGPQDIQTTVTRDVDFGGAFNGSILKLIAANAPIRAVIGFAGTDSQTWRGLYALEDSGIRGPRDLIGRKVGVNTLGAHYEFVIQEYLRRGGLTDAEIKQVTLVVLPPPNAEQTLRLEQIDAVVFEPIFRDRAVSRGGLHLLRSDFDLFGDFTTAAYVLTRPFLQRNPNAARAFVEGTARAIDWAASHPREEVVARYRDIIRRRARTAEDDSAVAFWKSTGLAGRGGVLADQHFGLFIDWFGRAGDAGIGRLKPADVLTNAFNPFRDEARQG